MIWCGDRHRLHPLLYLNSDHQLVLLFGNFQFCSMDTCVHPAFGSLPLRLRLSNGYSYNSDNLWCTIVAHLQRWRVPIEQLCQSFSDGKKRFVKTFPFLSYLLSQDCGMNMLAVRSGSFVGYNHYVSYYTIQ